VIRVARPSITLPTSFVSAARRERRRAHDFFEEDSAASRQQSFDFQHDIWGEPQLRQSLIEAFDGRCAYCSLAWPAESLDIDHFRPQQGAVALDGTSSRQHYYWLAHEWENLYPSCQQCNRAKGAKFPVLGPRAEPDTFGAELLVEGPGLIDPCVDDPESVFVYLPSGQVISVEDRGRQTIDVLALNRPQLVTERRRVAGETILSFQALVSLLNREDYEGCARILGELFDHRLPLAAVRRQFAVSRVYLRVKQLERALETINNFPSLAEMLTGLRRYTNEDLRTTASVYFGRPSAELPINNQYSARAWDVAMRPKQSRADGNDHLETAGISSLSVRNFLGIESLALELSDFPGGGQWTMLLGENGAGKTTLLKAVAVALATDNDIERAKLTPAQLLRTGSQHGSVEVTLSGSGIVVGREFTRGRRGLQRVSRHRGVAVFAYGATRLLPGHGARAPRSLRPGLGNLFNPRLSLPGTRQWIPALDEKKFDAVARSLRQLLDIHDPKTFFERDRNGQILRVVNGQRSPLGQMSEGYRAMATLSLDLMRSLLARWDSLEAAEGIVLIDEIGAHLHPRWQMRVVEAFRTAFPRIQVVATTHDPLCLRGMRDGEVRALKSGRGGRIFARSDLPSVEGLTVDQLLMSEHFGLNSTVDPSLERLFDEYYGLLARTTLDQQQVVRLEALREILDRYKLMGTTRRERLLLESADAFLAREQGMADEAERMELTAEAMERLQAVWTEGLS